MLLSQKLVAQHVAEGPPQIVRSRQTLITRITSQMSPIAMTKEPYFYDKRALFLWQKSLIAIKNKPYCCEKWALFLWQRHSYICNDSMHVYMYRQHSNAFCTERTHSVLREHILYWENTSCTEKTHSVLREHILYQSIGFRGFSRHTFVRERILYWENTFCYNIGQLPGF
jgi:hypothetical protein